jgi:hypothetical protein
MTSDIPVTTVGATIALGVSSLIRQGVQSVRRKRGRRSVYHSRRCPWCHDRFAFKAPDFENNIAQFTRLYAIYWAPWNAEVEKHVDYCEAKWAEFVKNGVGEL